MNFKFTINLISLPDNMRIYIYIYIYHKKSIDEVKWTKYFEQYYLILESSFLKL